MSQQTEKKKLSVYAPGSNRNMSACFDARGLTLAPIDGTLLGDVVSVEMSALEGTGIDEVLFMGDDLPDLPMLGRAGFAVCPADAAPEVAAACDHVCGNEGGRGSVREVAELLLNAKGRWTGLVEGFQAFDREAG